MQSKRTRLLVEQLEERLCLAVSASVVNGSLVVTGEPNGAVQINALAATTYQVIDNGAVIGTFTGVTRNIRVAIDSQVPRSNDAVTVNLGGFTTPLGIRLDAGDGNNTFVVQNGTINTSLLIYGGSGNDTVVLQPSLTVGRHVWFIGYGGNDTFTLQAAVGGNVVYRAGAGADTFTFDEPAVVAGRTTVQAGRGADTATLLGQSFGTMLLDLSGGNDTLVSGDLFETTAAATFRLGPGNDSATLDGWFLNNLQVQAGNGADSVQVDGRFTGPFDLTGGLGNDQFDFGTDALFEDSVSVTDRRGADTATFASYFMEQVFVHLGAHDDTVTLTADAYFQDDLLLRTAAGHDSVTSSAVVLGRFDVAGGGGLDTLTLLDGYFGTFLPRGFDEGYGAVVALDETQVDLLDILLSADQLVPVDETLLVLNDRLAQESTSVRLVDGSSFPVVLDDLFETLTQETLDELLNVPAGFAVVLDQTEVDAALALGGNFLVPSLTGELAPGLPGNPVDGFVGFGLQDLAQAQLAATVSRQRLLSGIPSGVDNTTQTSLLTSVLSRMLLFTPGGTLTGVRTLA